MRRGPQRDRIGIIWTNAFHENVSPKVNARAKQSVLGRGRLRQSSSQIRKRSGRMKAAASLPENGGFDADGSAVAQAVGGPFPLIDVVGDHARRLHRGLAELGIAGNLALDALAFGMQQVAQAFQFLNQLFDFRERGAGDALDQRVDVVDGRFALFQRHGLRVREMRPAQIGDVVANEFADTFLDLRDRVEAAVVLGGRFNLFGTIGSVHRLFLYVRI